MPPFRTLLGLSIGSGLEGVDVAVVQTKGIGLNLLARVERSARLAFPPYVRESLQPATSNGKNSTAELTRQIADTAALALRNATAQSERGSRDVLAVGFLEPRQRPVPSIVPDWPGLAERVADQTGLTVIHGYRGRDRAGGGSGHPIAAAADYFLYRQDSEERLLVHLGSVASVVLLPAGGNRIAAVQGFDAGPCNQMLDALIHQATRGREGSDPGGKRAVQGCCVDALLTRWREHPFFARKPPRTLGPDQFTASFAAAVLESARRLDVGLSDLLCTATHWIARAIGDGIRRWFPAAVAPRRVVLSGGGVRNGFLWQLLGQQFEGSSLVRLDELGTSALGRNAAGAAVMAGLLLDGVPGNLPLLTGASAGRPCGLISPGDARNWARCVSWMAEQAGELPRFNHAA